MRDVERPQDWLSNLTCATEGTAYAVLAMLNTRMGNPTVIGSGAQILICLLAMTLITAGAVMTWLER